MSRLVPTRFGETVFSSRSWRRRTIATPERHRNIRSLTGISKKKRLEILGEMEGTWLKFESRPPKGGWGPDGVRPEPRWDPYLWIWWQPQDQAVKPIGNQSSHPTHWVNPPTMVITKEEPKAAR